MRILKILIILPVLAYGLVMGYLWLKVKNDADDMVKAASGFADIKYDSVYVSMLGNEVGLNNIVIKPQMTTDEFRIEGVRLSAPHAGYFIKAGNSLEKNKLPETIGIKVNRIHLNLNSEIFTMLEQMQEQAAAVQPGNSNTMMSDIDGLGCGDAESLTLSDYRRMGLNNIVADMNFDINYNKNSSRTDVHMHLSADNLYNMDMQVAFNATPEGISSAAAGGQLQDMMISYNDTGYYKLRNAYCAEQNNSSVEAYIDRHISLLTARLGATFPEPVLAAYKQHMLKGGKITASLNPADDMPVSGLEYYSPAEIMNMLGLRLSINDTTLDANQIRWNTPSQGTSSVKQKTARSQEPEKQAIAPRPQIKTTPKVVSKKTSLPTFHKVDINQANKHLNRTVEVTLYNGKVRKGVLEKTGNGRLYLVLELHGGTLSYPVKTSDVKTLMVRY